MTRTSTKTAVGSVSRIVLAVDGLILGGVGVVVLGVALRVGVGVAIGVGLGVGLSVRTGLGLGVTGVAVGLEVLLQLDSTRIDNTTRKLNRYLFMITIPMT